MAKKVSSKRARTAVRKARRPAPTGRNAARRKAGAAKRKTAKSAAKPPRKAKRARKVKCPLSRTELKKLLEALLAKRRSILGDMSAMEAEALSSSRQAGAGDLSSAPTHPADVGTDNYEQEFTLGLLESERMLLAEIDEALVRMNEGTYGICLGTGKPINETRLEARPWARYCIEHARLIEKGLVQPSQENQTE